MLCDDLYQFSIVRCDDLLPFRRQAKIRITQIRPNRNLRLQKSEYSDKIRIYGSPAYSDLSRAVKPQFEIVDAIDAFDRTFVATA